MTILYLLIGLVFALLNLELSMLGLLMFMLWVFLWPIMLLLVLILMYAGYKLAIGSAVILRSAGKMKTGNDLAEQLEDTVANESVPNFFQFYYRFFKKGVEEKDRKVNDERARKKADEKTIE